MNALSKIRDAGFKLELLNDTFKIEPASKLTQNQRDFLKSHKAEIMTGLQAEQYQLSADDVQLLNSYLDHIEEHDADMRHELLYECGRDLKALEWARGWATKTLMRPSNTVNLQNQLHAPQTL